jgi:energy-coupling factor transporter ATP-binding protein EcfA2
MRIKHIRLTWFRGAAEPVALQADCKSVVIYGRNGSGKSSFVDGIEYVIKGGKVAHLAHEYAGRNQERAIPNTHKPKGREAEVGIKFENDEELNVTIDANGVAREVGAWGTGSAARWDYQRIILRQDEVAEFIHSTKGDKYSALLPLFGLRELEVAAENLRQLVRSVEQQSKLAQKKGGAGQIAARRKLFFGAESDEAIAARIAALHRKYCVGSSAAEAAARCVEMEEAIAARIGTLSEENRRYAALKAITAADLPGAIKAVREATARLAGSVDPLIAEKLGVLQSADAFARKLTGQDPVPCPACGRQIPAADFKAHVRAEQDRLKEMVAAFRERAGAITALIDVVKSVKAGLASEEVKDWRESLRQGSVKDNADWIAGYDADGLRETVIEETVAAIEVNCGAVIEAAKAASKDVPPDVVELTQDKSTVEIAKAVLEGLHLTAEITKIEALIGFVGAVEIGVRQEIRERSESVIAEISDDIRTMWKILHPYEPIDNVRLVLPEDDKAIDIALTFYGKEQDSPRLTLSESYRNSLGLCIFLALAKREGDEHRPLILDDVVVSLDRNHRGMVVQLLEEVFPDRQVIVLTHDRDWFSDLRQQLDDKRWLFRSLLPYETPATGIRWSHSTTTFDDARALLKDRPDAAGNDARKIMDVELAIAAQRLQLRFPFLRGEKNDQRMAHDFLERLIGDGKKCLERKDDDKWVCDTVRLGLLDKADRLLVSWGNRGSHTFDLVTAEAGKLIEACEQALGGLKCGKCSKPVWFADAGGAEWVQCQCGELRWRYGKG